MVSQKVRHDLATEQQQILFGGNVKDSKPERQYLNSPGKLLQASRRENQAITSLQQRGRQSEHQRLLLSKENQISS